MDMLEKVDQLYPLINGIHQGIGNICYWDSYIKAMGEGPEEGETQSQWERGVQLASDQIQKEFSRIKELHNKLKTIEL